ncbi:MAG: double-strand break repair protein AddB [Paracoccus sp. (in: a-proteobacteria)]|uniref:double-strand break repair protein AddB n=1 Tax=Paracoccus sp. TaxID=267 RepID=UPI0026DF321D|nr:double-strand break repair protein AddB [Paracoccus sp. (in: a-proteobacteria)]MDO5632348.1 double-strand break repair protein AddB [Paracoccus sp. (in: a-proteobacteria)]
MADWQSGVFGLPCGVDFGTAFVRGYDARTAHLPPEVQARITVWVNSGRTLSALSRAFTAGPARLLPRLRLVTDLGAGDGVVAAPLARRIELARLIDGLIAARPELGHGQSIPRLAQSLSELMTEMQREGCPPEALDRIEAGDHARHWQNALAFLRIAARFHLGAPALDRAALQRAAAERLAADWASEQGRPDAPVIVAGSTGSHGGTRTFMQAVARLPMGAVVLPGYDFDQPEAIWDGLDAPGAEDHPQARFAALRAAGPVRPWDGAPAPDPARNRLVSLALRPAPVTDQWIADGPGLGDLRPATAGLTLIEADQPGTEAAAIAALIRDEVQHDRRVTLIAADRGLTRRVTAALDRWQIIPDDSAGRPLPLSPAGLLLRMLADLPGQAISADRLIAILKHPLVATGSSLLPRNQALLQIRDLELGLRRHGPAFPDGAALRDWAQGRGDDCRAFADWLAALLDGPLAALADDRATQPVATRLSALRDLAQSFAAGPQGDVAQSRLWQEQAGELTRAVLDNLAAHAGDAPPMTARDFAELLHEEMQPLALRADPGADSRVRIRGPREARTESHGTVILAGLNEGGWPQPAQPDPWLSRPMRLAAGLTLPERQIGLAAHDFQQGIAAERVILTRARRDADAETIPSRWLNRLVNLMSGLPDQHGPQALAAMRKRGAHWLALADVLAAPQIKPPPAPRPAPIPPPPALRELPVTDIATLIRDPYAIYARRVLRLRPLDPLHSGPDAALRGQVLHQIVERMLKEVPDPAAGPDALAARLADIAAGVLAQQVPWPAARAFWQARIARIARQIAVDELARRAAGDVPVVIETQGRAQLAGLGFTLTARPDRIDRTADGRIRVYDYKSGTPPSQKQLNAFDKQLPLTAALVAQGGFDPLGQADVAGIAYIQLGGSGETHLRDLPDPGQTWDRFVDLIAGYLSGAVAFTALRAPELRDETGDYAHLARFGEWDLTTDPRPEQVGDHHDG